jgi:excinuclease ABC subunit A
VIEHNLDVIKVSDRIIDLGPEGGDEGGNVIVSGTPEKVAEMPGSYTGRFLAEVLPVRATRGAVNGAASSNGAKRKTPRRRATAGTRR